MASDKNILGCEEQRCIKIEVCCNCLKQNNRLLLWLFGGFGGLDSDRIPLPSMAFNTSKFRTDRAATGPVANTLGPVGRTCPWGSLLGGPRVVFRYFSFLFHRFAEQDRVVIEWVCCTKFSRVYEHCARISRIFHRRVVPCSLIRPWLG